MISGQQVFFSSNLGGQDIFFPPKCSAGFFFSLLISLQDFFFLKKVSCLHLQNVYIYIVVIAVITLIWSCKALKCCKLYKIILV